MPSAYPATPANASAPEAANAVPTRTESPVLLPAATPAAAAPRDRAPIRTALPTECSAPLAFQIRASASTVVVAMAGAALGAAIASQCRATMGSFMVWLLRSVAEGGQGVGGRLHEVVDGLVRAGPGGEEPEQ